MAPKQSHHKRGKFNFETKNLMYRKLYFICNSNINGGLQKC